MRYSLSFHIKIPAFKGTLLLAAVSLIIISCGDSSQKSTIDATQADTTQITATTSNNIKFSGDTSTQGMILIPAGTFMMGADNNQAAEDEYPKHKVTLSSFWMDEHEVTNAQFGKFVEATGYKTTAERKPDWEQLKAQLPPGTPKPADDQLVPASLVFTPPNHPVDLGDYSQWWSWVPGADWQHPDGPKSNINGKDNYPVVHVSWDDAAAYCKWAGKRLPTEAEWEYASRGGLTNNIYPWGNEAVNTGKPKANAWDGHFPDVNTKRDGFIGTAPIKQYQPNKYKLYDMAGNVWEWCADWYRNDYYQTVNSPTGINNPKGPNTSHDPDEPYAQKKVTRGGSYMCNDSYCSGYRSARRMKSSYDSGMSNLGFRCVKDK